MADRRLQVFHTVARLLSFTKAAETLHMTQPAVTFQIRQLEEYFNTRLFDRTHNRISLTAVGERVFEYAERIIALYSEMDNRVRELTGDVSGILIIGASTTIAEYMLPSLLGTFKGKHPGINIRLKVSNSEGIVHMVEDNSVDVGIVESPIANVNVEVGNPEAVKSAVEAGLGVSIVSQATVVKELKLGSLAALPLDPPLERPFSIVFQRQKFRLRAMDEFMNFAHERCEKRSTQKNTHS